MADLHFCPECGCAMESGPHCASNSRGICEQCAELEHACWLCKREDCTCPEELEKLRADLATAQKQCKSYRDEILRTIEQYERRLETKDELLSAARAENARLRAALDVHQRGCQCGYDEACQFVRERDAYAAEVERLQKILECPTSEQRKARGE